METYITGSGLETIVGNGDSSYCNLPVYLLLLSYLPVKSPFPFHKTSAIYVLTSYSATTLILAAASVYIILLDSVE